ncbi:MAG: bifunctional homocysteine S-methyltransferase/methylenetetrahydrofolate reductase [Gemmatimonadetes bacterium]|uniref:Bifunctional homocysteine S-methyltransferase/methylenetetrahydrofolate reductase n=1 Tax=Candidatus Kutchimonas denitrificans TaxID=3056748 RepID=A0AAE5CCZ3_9BACT|nr:bifunctional homocysteine S-methyltransferase/methylenetetrahydrofolate reductase [Gemmatimonadota bacterium]NIR74864.1 bifunctional homocysteine S-methyltransferase/methylenetetrahydrofolate reductase [Candidatus Kutchimonas denitrificans]NIR99975.1 bifunctional homocysteine S-methyltransferase/methylenetetrahydrofolate reductase [Gemmatimonadota bacterium]NIT65559.1 bifunctional homocysteine S-methyltransferase/methylenetetrahydrofolate reductase [Gemmatimonadota bacterium]NIU52529.1 bifun
MPDFRALIENGSAHLFDGAIGTELYRRGVFINVSYDELNLKRPELVREVHRAYRDAGAEILETNTFGANRLRLDRHGLGNRVHEINRVAAELAREVAADDVYVAGSIGPLGVRIEPFGPTGRDEARALFREQAEALAEGGVDAFIVETFSDISEAEQAIRGCRDAADLPAIAQMTVQVDGSTALGAEPERIARHLDEAGADVVGLNCSVGPAMILKAIQKMAQVTNRPLSAQPNAGLPREVEGRKMYMASPEYFSKYTRRLIQAGVRFVGGCCGTTPDHIKVMSGQVRALRPRRQLVVVPRETAAAEEPKGVEPVPVAERSRLARKIVDGQRVTSVEILPPKGSNPADVLEKVRRLKAAGVDAVNVPDGPRAMMRMGVLASCSIIEREVGLETIPHYCCRDRNLLGMMSDLLGAHALGIRNLLIITGDPPKMGPYPDATAVFDIDSVGLTNLVRKLNEGLDPGDNSIGEPTAYFLGVGMNHASVDLDYELNHFYWKVDAGAQYAISQPIFDTDRFLDFLGRIDEMGIRIPTIAAIWPLVSYRNAEFLNNEVPGIEVPDSVLERMRAATDKGKEAGMAEGLAIAREMVAAIEPHVQGVQVSAPFGKVDFALEVFEAMTGWGSAREALP